MIDPYMFFDVSCTFAICFSSQKGIDKFSIGPFDFSTTDRAVIDECKLHQISVKLCYSTVSFIQSMNIPA